MKKEGVGEGDEEKKKKEISASQAITKTPWKKASP